MILGIVGFVLGMLLTVSVRVHLHPAPPDSSTRPAADITSSSIPSSTSSVDSAGAGAALQKFASVAQALGQLISSPAPASTSTLTHADAGAGEGGGEDDDYAEYFEPEDARGPGGRGGGINPLHLVVGTGTDGEEGDGEESVFLPLVLLAVEQASWVQGAPGVYCVCYVMRDV